MEGKFWNKIVLLIGMLFILLASGYMRSIEKKIYVMQYIGEEGKGQFTVNSRLIGMKKFGSSLLWIKQVLEVGSFDYSAERIKENSEKISYLDPYFIGNYYFSGTIVALIKSYSRYDYGFEILKRGLKYNPDDKYIKNYLGGIAAASKGDVEELLISFESILEEVRDDRLANVVAYLYEEKYKKSKDEKYIEKAIYYWWKMKDSKEELYQKRALEKLKLYKK
ncbi:MAG: hypothetical protein B6I28_04655 [Fusobacteriia bacterium 4572_132]|nr:MAG: hypothetical protein B6I28_04655 [Fusobacteriia bacterium 4572_132]